jgi:hypothetical protein
MVTIEQFIMDFGDGLIDQDTQKHILTFLNPITEENMPYANQVRYRCSLFIEPAR